MSWLTDEIAGAFVVIHRSLARQRSCLGQDEFMGVEQTIDLMHR